MSLWRPPKRAPSTTPGRVVVTDADGNVIREEEPDTGGLMCRKHKRRECHYCGYAVQGFAGRDQTKPSNEPYGGTETTATGRRRRGRR